MTLLSPNPSHQVARNAAVLFGAQIVTKVFGFAAGILLANYLDVEQFGTYGFVIAFSSLFVPLLDIGVDTFVVREIAAHPENRKQFAGTALLSKAVFSLFTFFILWGVIYGVTPEGDTRHLLVIATALTILRTFSATFLGFFRGSQQMGHEANSTIVSKILEICALLLGIALGFPLFDLLVLLMASSFLQLLYTAFLALRLGFLKNLAVTIAAWRHLVRGGLLFALTGISVNLYFQIDSVMLSMITGDHAVGLYRSAYNLVFALSALSSAVVVALFPMIAQSYERNLPLAVQTSQNAIVYSLMFALPIAFAGTAFADDIIGTLYSTGFAQAGITFRILIWWIPLVYVTNTLGYILAGTNLQRLVLLIAALNAVFNISLNFLLIPLIQENGAAAATVVTEFLGLLILASFVRKRFGNVYHAGRIVRVGFASAVFLPLLFLREFIPFPLLFLAGLIAYLAILFLVKMVTPKDLQTMIEIIRTKTSFRSGM